VTDGATNNEVLVMAPASSPTLFSGSFAARSAWTMPGGFFVLQHRQAADLVLGI